MAEYPNRSQGERLYKTYSRHILSVPLMLIITIGLVSPTPASPFHTPASGTSERKAILDVERKYVEDAVAVKPVVFHDVSMRVKSGWAYVVSHPRDAAGRKLWVFAQFKDKNYDPSAQALMHKMSTGWKLMEFSFGKEGSTEFRRKNPTAPEAIFSIATIVRRQPLTSDGWTLVRRQT